MSSTFRRAIARAIDVALLEAARSPAAVSPAEYSALEQLANTFNDKPAARRFAQLRGELVATSAPAPADSERSSS